MPPRRRAVSPPYPRRGLNEDPSTCFSKSRAPPESALTNTQLIDIFASVLNLNADRKKSLIGNICFCDAVDETGNGGSWAGRDDFARGGRLGRDHIHTLSDVPNHFIRDFLVEQMEERVNEAAELSEDQRQTALRALLPDLTADEVKEYCDISAKRREDEDRAYRAKYGIPEADATPEQIRKYELKCIMLIYGFKHERQAEDVLKQQEAVKSVDTTVDLTPRVRPGAVRKYEKYGPLTRSVIFPSGPKLLSETKLAPPVQMDRDCDQIRLMIRRFCLWEGEGEPNYDMMHFEFDLDDFQKALGITRQNLTAFLRKKGPKNGDKSQAYELAWEFFKRRELLGYPLTMGEKREGMMTPLEVIRREHGLQASDDEADDEPDVLRSRDHNSRPAKRQNEEADPGEDSSKRSRTTSMSTRRRSSRLER
ncbi:hypothetical protein diail_8091 [Diaporthe ilicicola]|nr:hypothetical protein diail_8091 [Diaporthe ilicicola]